MVGPDRYCPPRHPMVLSPRISSQMVSDDAASNKSHHVIQQMLNRRFLCQLVSYGVASNIRQAIPAGAPFLRASFLPARTHRSPRRVALGDTAAPPARVNINIAEVYRAAIAVGTLTDST
jgi:hypothetical protein